MVGDPGATSALADSLGVESLDVEPITVAPNLKAVLLAPHLGHTRFLRDVLPMKLLADAFEPEQESLDVYLAVPDYNERGVNVASAR